MMSKKFKIVGFAQLHNEHANGNLHNWFRCMGMCDHIYIYDQASDDGSREIYKEYPNTHVIESDINDFSHEIKCKGELLEKLLDEQPDTDFIFWMDGDTLLDNRLLINDYENFDNLCQHMMDTSHDMTTLGHYNLWRSDTHYRVDNLYHWLHEHGVYGIWRNTGNLKFQEVDGLHQLQYPDGLSNHTRCGYSFIHRGFATDDQLIRRYDRYKGFGQEGWALDRMLDETTLDTHELLDGILPDWFVVTDDTDPKTKTPLSVVYGQGE